jgi:hypothetical protein
LETLSELAIKYDTDKNSLGHNYVDMYEFWLAHHKVDSLLEIGFGNGSSARMWRAYYPEAKIYIAELCEDEYRAWNGAIDIANINTGGVDIFIGDATKPELWAQVPGGLDFIVDDGSHNPNDQIASLLLGLKKLRSRGLYFIEDTYQNFQTWKTFQASHCGHDILYSKLINLIIEQQTPNAPMTAKDFYVNRNLMSYPANEIYSYHIYKNVIVFEKA